MILTCDASRNIRQDQLRRRDDVLVQAPLSALPGPGNRLPVRALRSRYLISPRHLPSSEDLRKRHHECECSLLVPQPSAHDG